MGIKHCDGVGLAFVLMCDAGCWSHCIKHTVVISLIGEPNIMLGNCVGVYLIVIKPNEMQS